MHHTFANVYIIREDTTSSLHLIYGQMRYGGGILADYRIGASGYPTVAERVSGIVTEYTPV
jgi:hypothetical protein